MCFLKGQHFTVNPGVAVLRETSLFFSCCPYTCSFLAQSALNLMQHNHRCQITAQCPSFIVLKLQHAAGPAVIAIHGSMNS